MPDNKKRQSIKNRLYDLDSKISLALDRLQEKYNADVLDLHNTRSALNEIFRVFIERKQGGLTMEEIDSLNEIVKKVRSI